MHSFQPLLPFSIEPGTLPLHAIIVAVIADSALLTVHPAAFVFSTILPNESSFSMAFVFLELTNILLSIRPDQMTVPMHLVVEPVAFVALVVRPNVHSLTLNLIHVELSLVN